MAKKKSNAVIRPNAGLHLDRPAISLASNMLSDGLNFRIKNGNLENLNIGWSRFSSFTLNGPVLASFSFHLNSTTEILIFITATDMYKYNSGSDDVSYITPIYSTGTASASGTAVTGSGTTWTTNASSGDEISFGDNNETDPAATWYVIDSVDSDTGITLTTSAGTVSSGNYTIRKLFTGDFADIWYWDTFVNADIGGGNVETQLWLTNGVDVPIRWNGTDDQVEPVSALGFTCKSLAVYSNIMIFGNVTQSGTLLPTDIITSDVGTPDDISSGLASQFKVHGGADAILGMSVLGDYLAIYSQNHVTISQFVGGDLVFVLRSISNTIGTIAGRAIADFGNYHEFISADTQYRFNGASIEQVNDHIWRATLQQQDPTRSAQVFHFFDDEDAELLWVMPLTIDDNSGNESAAPSRAQVEHYLEDVASVDRTTTHTHIPYSRRSFPFTSIGYYSRQDGLTWDQITDQWQELNFRWNDQFFSVSFPLIIVGAYDGKVYTLNTAQNADGAAVESYVTFGRKATVDGRARGLVSRVYPYVSPFNNDIDITVRMFDHAGALSPASTTTITYDQNLNEGDHFVSPFRRGRFVEVKFGTNGISLPWQLSGYDIDVKSGGYR